MSFTGSRYDDDNDDDDDDDEDVDDDDRPTHVLTCTHMNTPLLCVISISLLN